jgi:hypothetical protein
MSAMATEFEVETETLEASPAVPASKRRKTAVENPDELDTQAAEVAQLAQEIAGAAAKTASELTLKGAQEQVTAMLLKTEKLCREMEEKYSKPRTVVLGVKLGDLPAKKLKLEPAKVLPMLLAQSKIGQAGGNWPLMTGPTGCGKTVAAEQVAETLGLNFEHVNCSEGMSETWLWGRQTPTGFVPGGLWKCFKDGGVFLFDEADAANDNVWLSINTMLANGHAYNPICGESVKRHKDFIAIAAANTNGKGGTGAYSGRSRLDGATLNRFAMFAVDYNTDLEKGLCGDKKLLELLWTIRVKLTEKKSADVVSTRDIKNGYLQVQAGFSHQQVLDCLALRMDQGNKDLFKAKE